MRDLHIIGGGPAGLAMGYHAKKNKIPFKIYEASNYVGGNISGNRLKHLNIFSILKNMIGMQIKDSEHLDGSFYYPKNGFGTIFEAIKDYIGIDSIQLGSKVSEIHHKDNSIDGILVDGKFIQTETLVSTLPLNIFINILRPQPPKEIVDQINKIEFRFLRL